MPDRWMDERERRWRERNWRNEAYGRGDEARQGRSWDEPRSFGGDDYGGRDRVFGERDTGAEYNREAQPGGRLYGRPEDHPRWQDRHYGGVSPAMAQGEYENEWGGRRFQSQDYTRGGRFYGDDRRQPIYREEWGQGRTPEYGYAPRGYDADRDRYGHGEGRYAREMRRPASGGTGGYDYERGYGDGGRERETERGGFLQRMGAWVGNAVDEVRRDLSGGERWETDRGHRGRGPKGYQRSDERISDDAHDRLTDDPWLDASNVSVSVSGGEVTLSGTVETREAKHRAERCVEDIPGVKHVQNNLRVEAGGLLTGAGKGYGDSVLDAQMRRGETSNGGGASSGEDSASTRTTTRRT
jgi:osmotically-inducible protein OsmY